MKHLQHPFVNKINLEIPILENEECWAMRVIDEHQRAQSSNMNPQSPSSETARPSQASNTRE